jgi:hypothetical protein
MDFISIMGVLDIQLTVKTRKRGEKKINNNDNNH